MIKKLAENVHLQVLPTKKYKTVHILVRLATTLTKENASLRTLLSSVLETNSKNYPEQTDISKKLSEMYGAKMGIGSNKKGNSHFLNMTMTLVNPKYLPNEPTLLAEAFGFLNDILFYPNAFNGQFDQETFDREKKNLQAYITSIYDDKQSQAALNLQEIYFAQDENQQTPGFGRVEDIEKITSRDLFNYYQEVLKNDSVDILVLGDVEEAEIVPLVEVFTFSDRKKTNDAPLYRRQKIEKVTKTEKMSVQQGKLNLAYQTDVYFHDANYFALQIFNGIFGGFAHSKLFLNVREKESMAYYASSAIDTFRGMMTVQTGIDSKNKERVEALILQQLEAIRQGEITDEEMALTKAMLKNQYILSQDNPAAMIEASYLEEKFPVANISEEKWLEKMNAVTKEDVQQIAQRIVLQAVYFMEGGL